MNKWMLIPIAILAVLFDLTALDIKQYGVDGFVQYILIALLLALLLLLYKLKGKNDEKY